MFDTTVLLLALSGGILPALILARHYWRFYDVFAANAALYLISLTTHGLNYCTDDWCINR